MGKPETTSHGTASIIQSINEEYEREYGDKLIAQDGSVTGTEFQYDGRSLDVSAESTNGFAVATNGENLLLLDGRGSADSAILSYSFGTPWDLSTLSYDNESFTVGGQAEFPRGMDTDGDTLIITGDTLTGRIFQYSFGSSWDVTTLSYDGEQFNTGDQTAEPRGITTDGETVILAGSESYDLYQYSMEPWDISTLSYDNVSYDVSGITNSPFGAMSDGEFLLLMDDSSNDIQQYVFGSTWDLSTIERDRSADVSDESNSPYGVYSGDGVAIVSSANPRNELLSYSYVPDIRLPER